MKPTSLILSLAFAAHGLAAPAAEPQGDLAAREVPQEHSHNGGHDSVFTRQPQTEFVLIDKDKNAPGTVGGQANIPVVPGNVPDEFRGQISAISPNSVLRCVIYAGALCTGDNRVIAGRVNDLGTLKFDNLMTSLNCTRKP